MGVAIGADAFMASIETITSQTRLTTVRIKGVKKRFHTRVWNDTVANLTLMALGSSAPEILLSTVEVMNNGMRAGELGPSTIVGSAAFNLMVIIAVCVVAIPAGETRTLKHLTVFLVTAAFSILAYFWLLAILVWWTPHLITLEEAALTFSFMFLLVAIAYLADKGHLSKLGRPYASRQLKVHLTLTPSPHPRPNPIPGGRPCASRPLERLAHTVPPGWAPRSGTSVGEKPCRPPQLRARPPWGVPAAARRDERICVHAVMSARCRCSACRPTRALTRLASPTPCPRSPPPRWPAT